MNIRTEKEQARLRLAELADSHRKSELALVSSVEESNVLSVPKWRRDAVLEREAFLRGLYKRSA